ncbi:MAG: hypoxanthine phosphoribosyltransferase [Candidatus Kapaibacterium sp.]|nr:hypoxanthine phosphoribosyltransferase [Candidatus Kapabacteria bacterium]
MNDRIFLNDKYFRKFIDQSEIDIAVSKIASRINRDYADKKPTFLVVLKGAMLFAADLLRKIEIACDIEVISAKSYGNGMTSSGEVRISDLGAKFAGRDIIIVEDIVDTGLTLKALYRNILIHNPASVAATSILSKPESREVEVDLKYVGIEIPPYFVVGYGLDYAESGRHLPEIYIADNENI